MEYDKESINTQITSSTRVDYLPAVVQDAIDNQLKKQELIVAVLTGKVEESKNGNLRLSEILDIRRKLRDANQRLRIMRLSVFSAHDAAKDAIKNNDLKLFDGFEGYFEDAENLISKHLAPIRAPEMEEELTTKTGQISLFRG